MQFAQLTCSGTESMFGPIRFGLGNAAVIRIVSQQRSDEVDTEDSMPDPNFAHGKICYIQMPAVDVEQSAEFYRSVFGWSTRSHADGATAFDDTVGGVSGMWDTSLQAVEHPGLIVSIMVTDAVATSAAIVAAGGTIVTPIDPTAGEIHGTFRDPAGNLMSIYQNG